VLKNPTYKNTADQGDQALRFRALVWSLMRFIVEKHGGYMIVSLKTCTPCLAMPEATQEACLKDLKKLLDYAHS